LQELRGSANICQLLDVFFSEKDQSICLVLEYIPTSLDALLAPKVKAAPKSESDEEEPAIVEPLSDEKIEDYMEQVLSGIIQMHSKHIMHRDIKSDNLLVQ
jgi:serine/threonine protein kinase